jgi:sulfite reductase beta subunit-like hemoprotein
VKYKEHLDETGLLNELDTLLATYKTKRKENESFGDFVVRDHFVSY